ncbi:glycoside hydrolase family 131 with beta-glucanase activity acting on beta-/beta-/beta-glucans [Podospora fimiseda]|uniref:Glycoside hydrolase family 131 with beta-glucanase activity acting on beta-/beta-/beta-glucans n=1 Tax=Podospora fimiseda TaxID=252190 RepID=A0AAN7BM15_9PEZI|nr:glycoside hydrolase family 131 with beta-glucanase activity acting on beta-/beta-/beta-glucans [Podospora fimiseda]
MKFPVLSGLVAQIVSVSAGTILWDGRFNDMTSSADLNKWSWGNQVGPYQYYIHGSSPVSSYVNLSPDYKNPADTGSKQGAKITLDRTAYWNGQNMRRTELIPQTNAPITSGKVYYHFSLMRKDVKAPATTREHQIAFFESHFTELKSGWLSGAPGISDNNLRWCVGGQTQWSTEWLANVWHNVAYEIDFSANTVAFWHSTGSDPLTRKVAPVRTSTSSNGADWHVGVLELPRDGYPDSDEDFYWSGVYIENGSLTTAVGGPGAPVDGGVSSVAPTSTRTTQAPISTTLITSTKAVSTTSTSSAAPITTAPSCTPVGQWAQCDGVGYSGCKVCAAPYTCKYSNDWYSQCI